MELAPSIVTSKCHQCRKRFTYVMRCKRERQFCEKCALERRNMDRDTRNSAVKSTTLGYASKSVTERIDQLPTHHLTFKRNRIFKASDILHAPAEKSIKMIMAILNEDAAMVGNK